MPEKDHFIVGTAGHIDHGKTLLVKALTGVDADTLPEEKLRGMTIELGFVFMEIPDYEKQIVFIDVPGHEKFIKTMAAGASHIEAALLVIAADEGINVQTREHLDILELLAVPTGLIALTKADLVAENELLELKSKVKSFVRRTFLENAPVIPVSSVTGFGLEEIKSSLMAIGRTVRKRGDSGIFRMPIDRVFTLHGFGTIVAGTVLSGEVRAGDRIEIFPDGIKAKVRGVQVRHEKKESSGLGKRTALNLLDVKKEMLRRGQCVGAEGTLVPTVRLDARLSLLGNWEKELKNRERVRLHIGTDEVMARLVLLEAGILKPGESAFVQLVLESPTVALPGDRFVIRSFSPWMTIGGGKILDATPPKHKRFDSQLIESLRKLEGPWEEIVEQMLLNPPPVPQSPRELTLRLGLRQEAVEAILKRLSDEGKLVKVGQEKPEKYLHQSVYAGLADHLVTLIKSYFQKCPHTLFMPFSDLRSQFLKLGDTQTLRVILDDLSQKRIVFWKNGQIGLAGHELSLKPKEQEMAGRIEQAFKQARFSSPLEEDVCRELDLNHDLFKNMIESLLQQEILARLSKKVIYHRDTLEEARQLVLEHLQQKGSMTIAELRDKLDLSRKYAQAILEHFDRIGLTKRRDDRHVLAKPAGG